jgi:hypothetical protein
MPSGLHSKKEKSTPVLVRFVKNEMDRWTDCKTDSFVKELTG